MKNARWVVLSFQMKVATNPANIAKKTTAKNQPTNRPNVSLGTLTPSCGYHFRRIGATFPATADQKTCFASAGIRASCLTTLSSVKDHLHASAADRRPSASRGHQL